MIKLVTLTSKKYRNRSYVYIFIAVCVCVRARCDLAIRRMQIVGDAVFVMLDKKVEYGQKPSHFLTDRSKAVLLLCIRFVICVSRLSLSLSSVSCSLVVR